MDCLALSLPSLEPGDSVWLPDRQTEGEVREEVTPRSYQIESSDGTYRRNRKDIIRLPDTEVSHPSSSTEPSETATSAETNRLIEPHRSDRTS